MLIIDHVAEKQFPLTRRLAAGGEIEFLLPGRQHIKGTNFLLNRNASLRHSLRSPQAGESNRQALN